MNAMVLCAGLGTRLRPLTETIPKPALPLFGQPLFRTTLAVLKRAGVHAVGINTHHLPQTMKRVAEAETARAAVALTVAHEPVIQGTGGGIRGLKALLEQGEIFVVVNGDVLFPLDLAAAVEAHRQSGAAASMVLLPMPANESFAAVECDANGDVRRIAGHGPGGSGLTPWHFTGVHVMTPRVFDFMSASGPEDINREVYPRLLSAGLRVHGVRVESYWSDLGTPARYLDTAEDILSGRAQLQTLGAESPLADARELAPQVWIRGASRIDLSAKLRGPLFIDEGADVGAGTVLGPGVYVGRSAVLEPGSEVVHSAVLEGVRIAADERLKRVIAWSGGRISG